MHYLFCWRHFAIDTMHFVFSVKGLQRSMSFLIWLLVWKWSLSLVWDAAASSSEVLWGLGCGHLLSKWQATTRAHIWPLGFCKPISVCLSFLYKWEKEGKREMGGRGLAHPALENQKDLWSVMYAPLAQLCTDPNLKEQDRSMLVQLLRAFLYIPRF